MAFHLKQKNKTELFLAKRHPVSGKHGCYESHVAVIDLAKTQRKSTILVLEDDFKFTPDWSKYTTQQMGFISITIILSHYVTVCETTSHVAGLRHIT